MKTTRVSNSGWRRDRERERDFEMARRNNKNKNTLPLPTYFTKPFSSFDQGEQVKTKIYK